jgi:hypothetical protein
MYKIISTDNRSKIHFDDDGMVTLDLTYPPNLKGEISQLLNDALVGQSFQIIGIVQGIDTQSGMLEIEMSRTPYYEGMAHEIKQNSEEVLRYVLSSGTDAVWLQPNAPSFHPSVIGWAQVALVFLKMALSTDRSLPTDKKEVYRTLAQQTCELMDGADIGFADYLLFQAENFEKSDPKKSLQFLTLFQYIYPESVIGVIKQAGAYLRLYKQELYLRTIEAFQRKLSRKLEEYEQFRLASMMITSGVRHYEDFKSAFLFFTRTLIKFAKRQQEEKSLELISTLSLLSQMYTTMYEKAFQQKDAEMCVTSFKQMNKLIQASLEEEIFSNSAELIALHQHWLVIFANTLLNHSTYSKEEQIGTIHALISENPTCRSLQVLYLYWAYDTCDDDSQEQKDAVAFLQKIPLSTDPEYIEVYTLLRIKATRRDYESNHGVLEKMRDETRPYTVLNCAEFAFYHGKYQAAQCNYERYLHLVPTGDQNSEESRYLAQARLIIAILLQTERVDDALTQMSQKLHTEERSEQSRELLDFIATFNNLELDKRNERLSRYTSVPTKINYPPDEILQRAISHLEGTMRAWFQDGRIIPLGSGFFGVPISQTLCNRLSRAAKEYYDKHVHRKLQNAEETMRFPQTPHDCWIGKHRSPEPRVDIEKHYPNGNTPHFQRLRFQEGSEFTYGGLKPIIDSEIPHKILLQAYLKWTELSDAAYLVIIDARTTHPLKDILIEVYHDSKR